MRISHSWSRATSLRPQSLRFVRDAIYDNDITYFRQREMQLVKFAVYSVCVSGGFNDSIGRKFATAAGIVNVILVPICAMNAFADLFSNNLRGIFLIQ